MTKTTFTSYFALLLLVVFGLAGPMSVQASEVTGTLSSDTSSGTQTSGNISGTVSSGSSGGSGGGVSRSSGSSGGSSSNRPSGSVLGASTDNTQTPGFPNAGFAPDHNGPAPTYWSTLISFLRSITPF